jgi:predicted MFS family arabinose efflux permease
MQREGGNATGSGAGAAGSSLGEALRSRPFWLLYAAGIATSFGMFIPFVHLAPYAVDLGLSETFGVLLVGLVGVGSVIGRFLLGGTADRIGRRRGSALMFLGMAVMLLVWLAAKGPVLLIAFALLFGTFYAEGLGSQSGAEVGSD